jgi:hypothetical protein
MLQGSKAQRPHAFAREYVVRKQRFEIQAGRLGEAASGHHANRFGPEAAQGERERRRRRRVEPLDVVDGEENRTVGSQKA